jgi:hypothetical protein
LGPDFGHSISMLSISDYWDLSLEFFVWFSNWAGFVFEKLIGVKTENELGLKRVYIYIYFPSEFSHKLLFDNFNFSTAGLIYILDAWANLFMVKSWIY